jgi:dTDP-4-amino-4,6-dideoxygalactose transaminase
MDMQTAQVLTDGKPARATRVPFVDLKAQYATIRQEVLDAIAEALNSMELTLGPNVRAFEAEFATYCGSRYAVGVGSGTDALYLALRACGVGPGDEVITAANSFIATAEAIVLLGATPVFVDVLPGSFTIDPSKVEAAISRRTRALVPIHLYGQMADMDAIMQIARRHGLVVVEDACQAHGAEDAGRRAGTFGDAAAFSFYVSKNLGAYGEGGAVTTSSRALADEVRKLRDHGSTLKYVHDEMGVNSRLDELQAATLRVKLRHLDAWNERRRSHAQIYAHLLHEVNIALPVERPGTRHVFHLYVIQTDDRDRVREALGDMGVATGIHYPIPIHRQTASLGVGRVAGELRVTEEQAGRILSLPMYPEIEPEQIAHVAECLRATRGLAKAARP